MNARVAVDGASGVADASAAAIAQGSNRILQPAPTFDAGVAAETDVTEQEERRCTLEVLAEELERRTAALDRSTADTSSHG